MARRRVGVVGGVVGVYYDPDGAEYAVFFLDEKERGGDDPPSTYYTDDKDDAYQTAATMVRDRTGRRVRMNPQPRDEVRTHRGVVYELTFDENGRHHTDEWTAWAVGLGHLGRASGAMGEKKADCVRQAKARIDSWPDAAREQEAFVNQNRDHIDPTTLRYYIKYR